MQEALLQIGNALLEKGDFIESLVKEIKITDKKDKPLHVLKFKFNTYDKTFSFDTNEEIDLKTVNKYLFIGSASGAASKQWYTTTNNSFYHISETIPNLSNMDLGEEINKKIRIIKENFYKDLGKDFGTSKNRFILDFYKIGSSEKSIEEIIEETKKELRITEVDKALKDALKKKFIKVLEDYIKEKYGLSSKEIGLYTIIIDDTPICNAKEYKDELKKEREIPEGNNIQSDKSCSACGSKRGITADIQTQIKFYINDKISFANNLTKNNFDKNMILCDSCLKKVLSAEAYVINKLSTRISNFTVYIVPHFIIGEPANIDVLNICSENIMNSFNTVVNYDSVSSLRDQIDNELYKRDQDSYFLINFIFYKKQQKATKIQRLIKDINPSIFKDIAIAQHKTIESSKKIFDDKFEIKMGLNKVYYLTPIRVSDGQPTEYKNLLDIYEAIFMKRHINKSHIISNIVKVFKVIFFEEKGYNVTDGEIHRVATDSNLFIKFLTCLGCLEEGKIMDLSILKSDEKIKKYIDEMKYSEEETGLFLLGYLIGEIGNSQRKRNSEGKKPILNKLNYAGMDRNKLVRLVDEVFAKLNQEKIRAYNEVVFNNCKMLIDKNLKTWSLNKQENLFYILSGYGYETTKVILSKKVEVSENEQ